MNERIALRALVFDSLEEQIAVIDKAGVIIDVNSAWIGFGLENGFPDEFSCVGCNYLDVVQRSAADGDAFAAEAVRGILDVIGGGSANFCYEYPCHSPEEKRWFLMRVYPLKDDCKNRFVISHLNITKRKLAEEQADYLARHDPLTGLANRRYFNEFLSSEMRRSLREKSAISLVLIDMDHFKDYNDELGHAAGDLCLIKLGQVLQTFSRRPSDLAARLGGDEFALVLGETAIEQSQRIAEAFRRAFDDQKLVFRGSRQVTVSVGVASVIPDQQHTLDSLFREADQALYRAKSAGRNRVIRAQLGT